MQDSWVQAEVQKESDRFASWAMIRKPMHECTSFWSYATSFFRRGEVFALQRMDPRLVLIAKILHNWD